MKIKALVPFTAFTGEMKVFNADQTGDLPDKFAHQYIEAGMAVAAADLPQLDRDGDGEPGGSKPHDPPALFGKTKAQLLAIAAEEGVDIAEGAKAREIMAAIKAKREGAKADEDGPPAE